MLGTWLTLVFAFVLLFALYSLSDRLQLLTNNSAKGRLAFFAGTSLLLVGSLWTTVRLRPDYVDWFIPSAYLVIDIVHLLVLVAGLIFVVYGLSRFFESLMELQAEVEYREQKLNILENLQKDAREPYQFLELLNLAIKEIAATIPEGAGAVLLSGRSRKQVILATSVGLTSKETSCLEYYQIGDTIVSQALESGEPLLAGSFNFTDENGSLQPMRFKSILVLPLISGMDRIGCIILFSPIEWIFGEEDIKVLAPVGEWLAEKIKSARAARELTAIRQEKEDQAVNFTDAVTRIESAAMAPISPDPINNLCIGLMGFADSESVHLISAHNGSLEILGGSEPLVNLGEPYIDALANSIARPRPSVVNQNSEDDQGKLSTNASTLVYPLNAAKTSAALILRRQSNPFALDNVQLKVLSVFAQLAVLTLDKLESDKSELTHRLGFDKVVHLLRLPVRVSFEDDPGFFARHLASLLPPKSVALSFIQTGSVLKLADVYGETTPFDGTIEIAIGEGFIGKAAEQRNSVLISGKTEFDSALNEFAPNYQFLLKNYLDQTLVPALVLACPLIVADKVTGVIVFCLRIVSEYERREWERLITLACGLYSLRLTVAALGKVDAEITPDDNLDRVTNALNNNLAAVIGNAEILMSRSGLDHDVRSHIQSILNEAEVASGQISNLNNSDHKSHRDSEEMQPTYLTINDIAQQTLKRSHISENLYMVAGRAREIEFKPGSVGPLEFSNTRMQELFNGAFTRFASLAEDDDVITIITYSRENFIYLDISRHRRNFPPVETVAGFGSYQLPEEAVKLRPSDKYLEQLAGTDGRFAYDRFSTAPSYLSFKFPAKKQEIRISPILETTIEILAVDDQPVILELISAMCQTLGYHVTTARSGSEALSLAKEKQFDVILTDLAMPGMSGLELSRELRTTHPETPIILVTGWEATIDRQELVQSGINDILYKPFRIEQLTNLVKAAATGQSA